MSDFERETRISTDDPAYVRETVRTTTVEDAAPVTYVREGGAGPWIVAALVAVLAIVAILFLMNRNPEATNTEDLTAAMDASRAAGYMEGATTAAASAVPQTVQVPVPVPSIDTSGIERSAADAADAAADARAAAERAADSAAASVNADTSVSSNTTP